GSRSHPLQDSLSHHCWIPHATWHPLSDAPAPVDKPPGYGRLEASADMRPIGTRRRAEPDAVLRARLAAWKVRLIGPEALVAMKPGSKRRTSCGEKMISASIWTHATRPTLSIGRRVIDRAPNWADARAHRAAVAAPNGGAGHDIVAAREPCRPRARLTSRPGEERDGRQSAGEGSARP